MLIVKKIGKRFRLSVEENIWISIKNKRWEIKERKRCSAKCEQLNKIEIDEEIRSCNRKSQQFRGRTILITGYHQMASVDGSVVDEWTFLFIYKPAPVTSKKINLAKVLKKKKEKEKL